MRLKTLILTVLVFLFFISHGAFAHSSDKNGKFYLYKAEKIDIAPNVDGVLDERVWEDAEKAPLEWDILKDQPWKDFRNFEGRFAAVWRGNKVYVALWIEDDQVDVSNKVPAESDSIEIYIDRKHYAGDVDRHIVSVGQKPNLKNSQNLTIAWGGDNRTAEFVIDIATAPNFGEVMGFDIYYNDAERGRRENQVGWTPGDNLKDAANLGDLTFIESKRVREKKLSTTWGSIKTLY